MPIVFQKSHARFRNTLLPDGGPSATAALTFVFAALAPVSFLFLATGPPVFAVFLTIVVPVDAVDPLLVLLAFLTLSVSFGIPAPRLVLAGTGFAIVDGLVGFRPMAAFVRPPFAFSFTMTARLAAALAGDKVLMGEIAFDGDAGRDKKVL